MFKFLKWKYILFIYIFDEKKEISKLEDKYTYTCMNMYGYTMFFFSCILLGICVTLSKNFHR